MIELIRGRTLELEVDIYMDGEPYELAPGEFLVFTVKERVSDEGVLFQMTSMDGKFVLYPSDTATLPAKSLAYDVVLVRDEEHVYTVIPDTGSMGYDVLRLIPGVHP